MGERESFTIKSFYNFLGDRKLMGVKCLDCSNLMVPPRMICTECKGRRLEWFEFKGDGKLETFTVIHVAPTIFKDKAPYVLGIVRLEEGPMITGRVTNVDPKEPENIKVGMKVRVDFVQELGQTYLAFRPA